MTRLGAAILLLILFAVVAFGATLSFGPAPMGGRAIVRRDVPANPAAVTAAPPGYLIVPVAGYARGALQDSWGDPRGGGVRGHHGTDLIAPRGTPVVAAAPGTIEKLHASLLGGTTLYERSADRRWTYYYAHLAGYAPGIHEGQAVRAGDVIGYVGDTGDAGAGNYHLHFGIARMAPGQRWWQGEDVDPYPILARIPPAR